uniref:Excinuclease ABC C subunit domain-containing protein, putative endonuclease n=1 Tax=uncultured Parcubacteria bacterium Rifle_16ft_4_minimus_37658 TaxID=1665141 RepID=A0A0H4T7F2_9BACT|nr:Excinuclease ABC C subunit domain-containing protein, putative endonuclease [uncultured Parcubacteria bacterium Rifle_16ft_4_minimus_37658]
MIYVYVIESINKSFRYVGITNNVNERIRRHNLGYNKSTKPNTPYELILVENYTDYKEARKREKFLKSGQGREFLNNLK